MSYQFPYSIESKYGEKITFLGMEGDRLILQGVCAPNAGPGFHTHLRQDEGFTVIQGKMGYQIFGEEPAYAGPGDSLTFNRGIPHRFWNAGQEDLHLKGWINPAENVVFFLTALYDAMNKGADKQPEIFDGSYLACRYKGEYDVPDVPVFVKKAVMPFVYFVGKLLGKYRKFAHAPKPL